MKAPKRCRDRLDLSQCNNGEDMKSTKRLINEALIRGGVPRCAIPTTKQVVAPLVPLIVDILRYYWHFHVDHEMPIKKV